MWSNCMKKTDSTENLKTESYTTNQWEQKNKKSNNLQDL